MRQVRRSHERGHFDHGWLNTYHTFSFADYHDPGHMSFRSLRVMNEDRVQPAKGFGMHGHRDMEIVTYVLAGSLEHKDSLGNGSVVHAGEFQRMSAGTGVLHSEFNPSATEIVHLYQIWLFPERKGLIPSYEQRTISDEEKRGRFRLAAAPGGREGSLTIHQDAAIYLAALEEGEEASHPLATGRYAWLQVLRGVASMQDLLLEEGDGVAVSEKSEVVVRASGGRTEVMLFDLA